MLLSRHIAVYGGFILGILSVSDRCWDLSAGSMKWIIQIPILTAVVVSKKCNVHLITILAVLHMT